MTQQKTNTLCAIAPIALSVLACVWVLGNVAGGARSGGDEGLGFHVFWLLILAQLPLVIGYLLTAEWKRRSQVTARIALQAAALVLAFAPVAYFHL